MSFFNVVINFNVTCKISINRKNTITPASHFLIKWPIKQGHKTGHKQGHIITIYYHTKNTVKPKQA